MSRKRYGIIDFFNQTLIFYCRNNKLIITNYKVNIDNDSDI